MPATSSSSVTRMPIVLSMSLARIAGDDEGVGQDREDTGGLLAELVEAAAVEEALDVGLALPVAKKPTSREPTTPPTRWTPTTSRESS